MVHDGAGGLLRQGEVVSSGDAWEAGANVRIPRILGRQDLPLVALYTSTPGAGVQAAYLLMPDGSFYRSRIRGQVTTRFLTGTLAPERLAEIRNLRWQDNWQPLPELCNPSTDSTSTILAVNLPGARFQLVSSHPLMETTFGQDTPSPTVMTAYGSEPRGGRTDEQWLAKEPECFQAFRLVWRTIEELADVLPPVPVSRDQPVALVDLTLELVDLGPPILPGSPVPQPAPGP
jgi:hypothetical protein